MSIGCRRAALLGAVLSTAWSVVAVAQIRVDVAPSLGGYVSFGSSEWQSATDARFNAGPVGQTASIAVGGDVAFWLTHSLGVDLHLLTAASDPAVDGGGRRAKIADGRVTVYGARFFVGHRSGEYRSTAYYIAAGPSVVQRSGDAFRELSGTTSVAASFGLGGYHRLADGVNLKGDASLHIYGLHLGGGPPETIFSRSTQGDLTLRLGVAIRMSRSDDDWENE